MKNLIFIIFTGVILNAAHGQEKSFARRPEGPGENFPHRGIRHDKMKHQRVTRQILSKKYIDEAELTQEQIDKLKNEFDIIDKKMMHLGLQIMESAKKQAEISVKVLTTPGDDGKEMMNLTERIGYLRTEQAKLQVALLMIIRDTLDPDQCAKVVELMKEQYKKKNDISAKFEKARQQSRFKAQIDKKSID